MTLTRNKVLTIVKSLTKDVQDTDERIFTCYIADNTHIIDTVNNDVVRLVRKKRLVNRLSYLYTDYELRGAIDTLSFSLNELKDNYVSLLKTQIIKLGGNL